ncbi:hypothetical protein H7F15_02955 [Pontibacter sp. Tf4]|uniref:DUF6443 domain-containing protein n=1 Tax=Pontibacter sp. Tf4 TaxID=2761620 RepID=UPI0016288F33|nr:DUF6443 domain-containing protein [Pontibacter sp. Tf4]MBB6609985.1 hypothetical protein [Pontibacter sp. Tf4]
MTRGLRILIASIAVGATNIPAAAQTPATTEGKRAEIITEVLTQKGYMTNAAVDAAAHPVKKTTISFIDGLGRPVQQVARQQSSDGNGNDVVQFFQYDQHGRQTKAYLPYVAPSSGGGYRPDAMTEQLNWYLATAGEDKPYAETVYDASPLQRVKGQGAPGSDWQPGTGHIATTTTRPNTAADAVSIFDETGRTALYYLANELAVTESTDENGNKVLLYTNKSGQQLLKRVQLDDVLTLEGFPDATYAWLETYYVYDTYGSLQYQVPPKAVELLKKGKTWSEVQELLFSYTYDSKGRLVEKKVPNSGKTIYKYDNRNRLALVQDANLRSKNSNSWYFTKYDRSQRPVMEGIYTFVPGTYASVDAALAAQTVFTEDRNTNGATHFYTNNAFPASSIEVLSVTYYDTYQDFSTASYAAGLLSNQEAAATTNTYGLATGKKTRVVTSTGLSSTWLQQVYYYDSEARLIQTKANNHLHHALEDVSTSVYDFMGKIVSTQSTVKSSAATSLTVENIVAYDLNSGLAKQVKQRNKLNGGVWDKADYQLVAEYKYDGLGKLLEKKLHEKASGSNTFLQTVDYSYNIRGWLTGINKPSSSDDLFTLDLYYNKTDAGLGNTAQYNGNISAVKWRVNSDAAAKERSYKFTYDKMDRLKEAAYAASGTTGWTEEVGGYDEKGIRYDHNGNITALQRNTITSGTTTATLLDNLSYSLTGNLLTKVEDLSGNAEGFHNRSSASDEMAYNDAGSLTKDLNKNITSITYNEINKVSQITITEGSATKMISYDYDATGTRLATTATGTAKQDYLGGLVVENAVFKHFPMAEGLVRIADNSFIYEYHLKDHLGNMRVAFTEATTTTTGATMEPDFAYQEESNFANISETRHLDRGRARTGSYAALLSTSRNRPVGPSRRVTMQKGDSLKVEAYGLYETVKEQDMTFSLLSWLAASAMITTGQVAEGKGKQNKYLPYLGMALAMAPKIIQKEKGVPKAYLRYIVYDSDSNYVTSGYQALGRNGKGNWEKLELKYKAEEDGFAEVYLANESGNDAWFDDMSVSVTSAMIVQENHYYPFGMVMQGAVNGIAMPADATRRLFNGGAEWQNQFDVDPNYHSTYFREYDPVLGRFNGIDPMADAFSSWSPYQYAFNNPVLFNDPNGAKPVPIDGYDSVPIDGGMVLTSRGFVPLYALGGSGVGSIAGSPGGLYWANGFYTEEQNKKRMSASSYFLYYGRDKGTMYFYYEKETEPTKELFNGNVIEGTTIKSVRKKGYRNSAVEWRNPSETDIILAGIGTLGYIGEKLSQNILNSRSGFTSGKMFPNSPSNFSKARAKYVKGGLKVGGWGLTLYGLVSTQDDYEKRKISRYRRDHNLLLNAYGFFFPSYAVPLAIGDYFGQIYSKEINDSILKPGGVLHEATILTLETLGIPSEAK